MRRREIIQHSPKKGKKILGFLYNSRFLDLEKSVLTQLAYTFTMNRD